MLPYPLLSSSYGLDVGTGWAFGLASTPGGDPAGNWYDYIRTLQLGGLGGWQPASTVEIQRLYTLAESLPKAPSKPKSYSAVLNQYGFHLTPGPVTTQSWCWSSDAGFYAPKAETICANGFLTVSLMPSYLAAQVYFCQLGWIDDAGNTGVINPQPFLVTSLANLASVLDGDHTIQVQYRTAPQANSGVYYGQLKGPMVYVTLGNSASFTQPSFAFVPMGAYNGFTLRAGTKTADALSNGSSYTQPLTALPNGTGAAASYSAQYPMTNEVFWHSSDPTTAPISNVAPVVSASPTPTPEFTPLPNAAGTIHWLAGSAGKSVTFTASRSLPNGTRVSGTVTLLSPVTAGIAPQPDAIEVWPSNYNIYSDELGSTGVKLYVSRHFGSGFFEDVATVLGQPGKLNVTYSASDPNVAISSSGLVLSTAPIADGATITVTITDPMVPVSTDATHTRASVTATINVIAR